MKEQKIVIAICGIRKAVLFSISDGDSGTDYEIDCYDILRNFFDLKINIDIPGRCFKLNPGTFDSIQNYFNYVPEFSAIFETDTQITTVKMEKISYEPVSSGRFSTSFEEFKNLMESYGYVVNEIERLDKNKIPNDNILEIVNGATGNY